ncbi:Protein ZW2 [Linum grandiflorum]
MATTSTTTSFESFFNDWLTRQEHLLSQLLEATKSGEAAAGDHHLNALIDQCFFQHRLYYREKSNAATRGDALLFLSPPWLTSFERSLLWLGEFRPSTVFRLVSRSVKDLTADQCRRIEQVRRQTRREEIALTEAMATIQESMASPRLLRVARATAAQIDGERREVDEALESLKAAMLSVMMSADSLRGMTVAGVVEALSPMQTIAFLVAAAEFQLSVRRWGQEMDRTRIVHQS